MKQLVIISTLVSLQTFGQVTEQLDINTIRAGIEFNQPLFYNSVNSTPGFETPINSGIHSIFGSGLMISMEDINGQAHASMLTYNSDFNGVPGFDQLYKINKSTIDSFVSAFNDPAVWPTYQIPQEILNWPAHGDVQQGMDYYLAPFVDVDQDGQYIPSQGDYPSIKGDQAIWWFMEDHAQPGTGGNITGLEYRCMAYAFNCADSALQNTVFVEYDITNKSTTTFYNARVGSWADLDIGCNLNDYIGTDVSRGLVYGYSASRPDQDCNGLTGHSNLPSFQGMIFLGTHADNDGQDNPGPNASNNYYVSTADALLYDGIPYSGLGSYYGDGIVDNERLALANAISLGSNGINSFPNTDSDVFNIQNGYYLDGSPWQYVGTSHTCSFFYPGNSDPQYWNTQGNVVPAWQEESWNGIANTPGERRVAASTSSFTLQPGGVNWLTVAYIFATDYTDTSFSAGLYELKTRADFIKAFFEQGSTCQSITGTSEVESSPEVGVYPNPSDGEVTINTSKQALSIKIYGVDGKLVREVSNPNLSSRINLSNQLAGLYTIQVFYPEAVSYSKLIIR